MKSLKNWIVTHKLLSIILAIVIVVGATLAIVLPIALAHKHEFSTTWTYDEENHWHACTGEDCNELQDKAAHVYDNACDADCNVCGAVRTVEPHVYDDEADKTCNVCGAERTLPTRYQAKDEAEWNAAFDFAKTAQFSATADNATQKAVIARDGDVISFIGYVASDSGMVKNHEIYYVKDGDNYYQVYWADSTGANYERETIDKAEYEMMFKNVLSIMIGDLKFSDFTFDATSNKYSNADATITHTLTFVGGVLTKIEATAPNGNPTATEPVSITITFEKNTITVPSSHVFAKTWTFDNESHWYACTSEDCDATKDKAVHNFSTKNDATKHWQECSTCGYKKDEKAHVLTVKEINVDDHVLKCDDCQYETAKQAHVFENDKAIECDVCGKERTETSLKFSAAFINEESNRKKVYDGNPYEFTESLVTTNVNFSDIIVEYKDRSVENAEWTTEKPEKYGTYNIRLRVTASLSHTSAEAETTKYVSVERKLLDLSDFSRVFALTELDKSSWEETVTNADIAGILPYDDLTIKFYKNTKVTLTEGTCYNFSTVDAEENAFAVQLSGVRNYDLDQTTAGKLYVAHSAPFKGSAIQNVYESASTSIKKNEIVYYVVNLARTNRNAVQGAYATNYEIGLSNSVTKVVEVFSRDSDTSVKIAEDGTLLTYGTAANITVFIGVRYTGINESTNNTFKLIEIIASRTVTDATAWINALKFNGGGYQVVLTKNGTVLEDCKYRSDLGRYYKNCDGVETYYTIESGECYQYVRNEGETYWVRRTITDAYGSVEEAKADFLDTIKLSEKWLKNIATEDAFKTFTFSNEDLTYRTETAYALGDVQVTKIALKFAGDKLTWVEFTDGEDVYVIKVVNNNSAVSLSKPSAYSDGTSKETAFVAPYDGNGNFMLEDVALTAGDNWFVIEITQAMIDEYGNELSGTFTAQNANAALTLAVKAYNEADTEITNDADENGAMYLEGLTAGKYYVKITANVACAGSLSMTIAV